MSTATTKRQFKCEMGWRPGMPPIGYYNRAFNGVKDIIPDPERAPIIKEMFERVAINGDSGRTLKRWFDSKGLTSRSGKKVVLSLIYQMLRNPFYYGKFQYPISSGIWYQGKHQPLITKELFDQVQKQLIVPRKVKWGTKGFAFKGFMKCGNCGASVIGEEKMRHLTNGLVRRHVYYHCSRYKDFSCREPYISEDEFIKQLIVLIDNMTKEELKGSEKLQGSLIGYQKVLSDLLRQQNIDIDDTVRSIKGYSKYALREGSNKEKTELIRGLKLSFILKNGRITPVK